MASCPIPTIASPKIVKSFQERTFVCLAYLDDSGIRPKDKRFEVISAVAMEDQCFGPAEFLSSFAIESLMPEDRREEFEEFHALELYNGRGVFEGIDMEERYGAIKHMLSLLSALGMSVSYGAVDIAFLKSHAFGSANPKDVAFRM
jgi:hypothetical protein